MKTSILISILLLAVLNSPAQSWQYALSVGGSDGDSYHQTNKPQCIEIDEQGNTYVFGNYGAGTEINDSTLKAFDDTQGSFIVKYNCEGEVDWFKAISNSSHHYDQASYMLRKGDYLYIMGSVHMDGQYHTWFIDTTVIGSLLSYQLSQGTATFPWISYTTYTYVIKMDLDGNILDQHFLSANRALLPNSKGFTSIWLGLDQKPFTIDSQGNYYFFADFPSDNETTLYCDSFPLITTTAPEFPHHILKFDSDFNFLWSKSIVDGISDNDLGIRMLLNDIHTDTQDNIYLVGSISTGSTDVIQDFPVYLNLGDTDSITTFKGDYYVGFLLKMDTAGTVQWAQQTKHFYSEDFGSSSNFESLLVDEETSSVYVEGFATVTTLSLPDIGTVFGESDTIFNLLDFPEYYGGFIAKYDTDGNYHWVSVPKSPSEHTSSLDIYENQLYGTISWLSELSFGDSVYTSPNTTRGFTLCTWDTAGNELSSSSFPNATWNDPEPYDTRVNNQGDIVITGLNATTMSFGTHEINAEGYKKIFIAKYAPNCTVSVPERGELAENSALNIYPNPAKDNLFITCHFDRSGEISNNTVEMYNIQGQLVKQFVISSEAESVMSSGVESVMSSGVETSLTIDISDLGKGLYIIRVGKQTQKLIVE